MPSEAEVPPGPHRQLLVDLHRAYAAAGRPGLRQIAEGLKADDAAPATLNYQAVGKILNGKQLPNPRQLISLASWLFREENFGAGVNADSEERLQRVLQFREEAHRRILGIDADAADVSGEREADESSNARTSWVNDVRRNERKLMSCMLQSRDSIADVVDLLNTYVFIEEEHRKVCCVA
jgi:replicative DNA helicase